jgi:hypothetical protein
LESDKSTEQMEAEGMTRIKPNLDDLEDETEFEKLIRIGTDVRSMVEASFSVGKALGEKPTDVDLVTLGMSLVREKGKLEKVLPRKSSLKTVNFPNLYAYGANRHMETKNLEDERLKDPILNLFSNDGALYDAEEVLVTLEYASLKPETKERGTVLFERVKKLLADLLPDVEGSDAFVIGSPLRSDNSLGRSRVEVTTPYGRVQISELSLGYKTMLSWALDLALRMFWKNEDKEAPLEEPAIVIMDEIDLHLHPRWQRNVRDYLVGYFPKTQFICTAHSPFMAQASAGDNLCVVHRHGNQAFIQNDPVVFNTWRIGQFVTSELFDVASERGKEIEAKVNRRRTLLDNRQRTIEEDKELAGLDTELANLPVDAEGSEERLINVLEKLTAEIKGGRTQA